MGIILLPYYVSFKGKTYNEWDLDPIELYRKMRWIDEIPTSSYLSRRRADRIHPLPYESPYEFEGERITLFPACHIIGSAQILIETEEGKRIVSTLGVLFGISGMIHGFFETLQGNTPTNGLIIFAIGEANRMWIHGNKPAFTLIPR